MRTVYWVWRRELAVMLRAPIVYLVGGLFLVVQGIAFAGLVGALSDPRRPAPLGALLEGQLAGTLLTWVLALVVLTLLGMRAIAEDKRSGGWEALLTAGVSEGAAVTGKWLAAVTVYAVVWLPTLAYLGVVALYRSDAGGWDLPAIVVGYVGAIVLGAALLAWAVAASAATASVLAAGALGFAWLIGLFLVGELPALWPDVAVDHPSLAVGLDAISLRTIATDFARGHVSVRSLAVLVGLAVVGLALAITLACAGRRRARELRIRVLGTLALAAIAVLAGALASRHPAGLDLSAARRSSLDPQTRAVLAELPGPAALTIVQPTLGALEPVYDEVARVAARLADVAPSLTVRRVDPASAPGGLTAIARAAGLQPGDLASGGAIVVELGGKRRVVDLLAFAAIDRGPDGAPTVERLAIEQALAGALAALSATRPLTVCATRGHGELGLDPASSGHDWSAVAQRLRADGATVESIDVLPAIPARCTVVLVPGPSTPFSADEALAIQRFTRSQQIDPALSAAGGSAAGGSAAGGSAAGGSAAGGSMPALARGGGLLVIAGGPTVAVDASANRTVPPTGLEGVLAEDGLGLPPAIAVDPSLGVREVQNALYVVDGYAEHSINAGFAKTRPTLWIQPRAVVALGGARPLIVATSASWGERDLVDPPAKDPDDLAGPVALAAIGSSQRTIAIGSAESFTTAVLAGGASAGDLWLTRAVRYVSGVAEPA
ncbi:MAG TPA: Gldg family protein, partial [Kofleriaceae bacterium]|nr:Gldg family protein [Kofleriaceae bacterium]